MIELAELVRDLRKELGKAIDAAPEEGLRFELGPIELQVSVGVEKTGSAGAKARFWVLELGADGATAKSTVQIVKLTLQPRTDGVGRSPYVSGRTADGER